MMSIMTAYLAVHSVNSSNPQVFNMELDYGIYDFKYSGFTYTYHYFKESVVPIVGKNANGDDDNGTAYYIGENRFVTASHCVDGLERFNLLKPDGTPYALRAVLFAAGQNHNDYDLAVIVTDEVPVCQPLWLGDPAILDDVLVMGYPPIPGLNPVLTAETATVATSDKAEQIIIWGAGARRMSARELRESIEGTSREIRSDYLTKSGTGRNLLFDGLPAEMAELMEDVRLGRKSLADAVMDRAEAAEAGRGQEERKS